MSKSRTNYLINFCKSHVILLILFGLYVMLRIPSLFEPHWYADEGIYAAIANAITHGKKLYIDVFDNRLPGIYYLYALGTTMNRLFFIRSLNLFAGLISLIGIYCLGKKLALERVIFVVLVSAVFFLGTPIIEANVANTENFFIPLTIWALWLTLSKEPLKVFIAGSLFGLAFLIKFSPFFTFVTAGFYLFWTERKSLIEKVKSVTILIVGFIVVIAVVFAALFFVGNLAQAIQYGLVNNISYVSHYSEYGITSEVRIFLLLLTLSLVIVCYTAKKITNDLFFIIIFTLFDYYAAIFSGRKYEHYLLQVVPSISLLLGYVVIIFNNQTRKRMKLVIIFISTIFLFLGSGIFYLGMGSAVRMPVGEYYKEYLFSLLSFPYKPSLPFTFFKEPQDIQDARTIALKYQNQTIYFYTNQPWIWDFTHTVPPVFFVAEYHQYLIPYGAERLVSELAKSHPSIIAVDKKDTLTPNMKEFLNAHYLQNSQDQSFIHYQSKDNIELRIKGLKSD